jgi:transcriptional regulator with XRE-family HTH domain
MTDGIFLKEMGSKMRAARKAKKLTLRQLGEMCKLDYSAIARIECGYKSSRILTLKIIAEKLGVDVKDFL